MKIVKRVLFVLFVILFCSNQLHAQNSLLESQDLSQTKIDDYNDSQLTSFYNKALESGITEDQLYSSLAKKGLPENQIARLRERLQSISGKNLNNKNDTGEQQMSNEPHPYDTTGLNKNQQYFQNDQSIFGSELFTSNSLVFEPNLRIPA